MSFAQMRADIACLRKEPAEVQQQLDMGAENAIAEKIEDDGDTDDGFALCDEYEIRDLRESGFFPPQDAMNAQLQVFNSATVPGSTSWQIRVTSNYSINSITPSAGFTIGAVQTIDNGTTYDHIIPVTGPIPGNNGNMQVSITGNRHPQSTDTVAAHTEKELFCS